MKFIEYILVKESDLEDLFVSYNAKDNIELIHEMEYKLRNIIKNKYKLNPKLYVNVVKRFSNFALEAYNQLSPSFHELFKYWLSIHNISSPEAWAEAIYAEYEEFVESEGVISVGGVSLTSAEIFKELESDDILKILKYNFGGDILNNFSAYSGHFLTDVKSYPVPEDENEDYWIDNEYDAIEMIIDNYWESEYALYVAEVIRDDSDGYLELGEYGWKIGLEKVLYPKYYQRHGYNIETAIPEVEEAIERIESGNSSRIDAENIILNLHSDDEDLDQQITRLMKLIGNLTIAISLSMNVMHTCGNIMTDYGDKFGLEDIDPKFLDDFNTRSVGDWNDELRKIIRDI